MKNLIERLKQLWAKEPTVVLTTIVSAIVFVFAKFGIVINKADLLEAIGDILPIVFGGAALRAAVTPNRSVAARRLYDGPRKHLGRLDPGTLPEAVKSLRAYLTTKLSPPSSWKVPIGPYPMDCNDRIGDCVMAGVAHCIHAWNVAFKKTDRVPTEREIETEYFKLTGGEDTGLVESDTLTRWVKYGLFGQKAGAFCSISPRDINGIKASIAFYGACLFGISCPESMQQQFAEGLPISYVPGSPDEGGHCIVGLGYDSRGVYCATWGRVVLVTWGFLAHKLEEAYCILPHEIIEAGKDTQGLDVTALKSDMATL